MSREMPNSSSVKNKKEAKVECVDARLMSNIKYHAEWKRKFMNASERKYLVCRGSIKSEI